MSVRSQTVLFTGLVMITAVLAALSSVVPIQIVIFGIVLGLAFVVQARRRILLMAAILVPVIALIRRLLGGETAYVAADPLVLLPITLLVIVLVSAKGRSEPRARPSWLGATAVGVSLLVVVTVLLRGSFSIDVLYSAGSLVIPLLLFTGIVAERVPDIWPSLQKVIPILAVVVGSYGIFQFLVLPEWDRNWMISSGLNSIGQPQPLLVRVFGTAESPGPYANFIGLAVVLTVYSATVCRGFLPKAAWLGCSAFLTIPLLLSGVRSALLATLVCAAVLMLIRGRGLGRVLPLVLIVAGGLALTRIIGVVGGDTRVLSAERYTSFSSGTDNSVQARLGLLQYLTDPFAHVIGTPSGAHLDNLIVDVLVSFGLFAALGIALLYGGVIAQAMRNLGRRLPESASICAIFIAVVSVSGNVFTSPFGILIAIVFGSTCLTYLRSHRQAGLALDRQHERHAS